MAGYSVPIYQWLLANGTPNAAGQIYVYQTGTTTTVNIYSDNGLTAPLSNPLTLDSNGESKFYVANTINLRIDSYDVNGGFIQSVDPVFPVGSTSNIIGTTVYKSANFNMTAGNIGQNIIATTGITINLPLTNTFNNYSEVTLNANGGAITLQPQSGEKFIGQSNGATKVIAQGSSATLWTDAAGTWGLNFYTAPVYTPPVIFFTIAGLVPFSIAGTNTTASLSIGGGQCADSTAATIIFNPTNISWAVSNGNAINGYSGGTTLPNSSTIHFFLCSGASGVGSFASTSLTPTFPTGYATYTRRMFSLRTNSSGAFISVLALEIYGSALRFMYNTSILDFSGSVSSGSQTLVALTVPSGLGVAPLIHSDMSSSAGLIQSPGTTAQTPTSSFSNGFGTTPGFNVGAPGTTAGSSGLPLITNTSAQIGVSVIVTNNVYIITDGYDDFRRG